jgi:hypothetical protein
MMNDRRDLKTAFSFPLFVHMRDMHWIKALLLAFLEED